MKARDIIDRYLKGEPLIHYLMLPGEDDSTALFIHGSFGNAQVWAGFASTMDSGLTLLAPDLRGHGSSAWANNGEYCLEDMVADQERLLEAEAPTGNLILVGHSLGNIVATKLAAKYEERVRALILVDHACRIETDHHEYLVRAGQRPARTFEAEETALAWAKRLSGKNAENMLASRIAKANIRKDRHGVYHQSFDQRFLSSLTLWDAESEMIQISCPVLIVGASVYPVLRKKASDRMLECFADARLSVVANAGHNVFLDQPDSFASLVLPFIYEILEN